MSQPSGVSSVPSTSRDEELPPELKRFCPSTHTASRTEIELATYSHTWTIANVSSLQEEVRSCEFPTNSPEKLRWYLSYYPHRFYSDQGVGVRLNSSFRRDSNVKTNISLCISLYESNGNVIKHHEEDFTFLSFRDRVVSYKEVVVECTELDLPNDELIVECSLTCVVPLKTTFSQKVKRLPKPEDNVMKHLTAVFRERKHTDVTISVKGKRLEAHMAILAACSPVFDAMFENHFKESEKGEIHIQDFEVEIVEAMLRFFYTGDIPEMDVMTARDILPIADKYNIEDLKTLCEDFLISNLSVENVLELLRLADFHDCPSLKKNCIRFFKSAEGKSIKTAAWEDLKGSNSDLLIDVIKSLID